MKKRLQAMLGERTLVLIKPDAVKRGLIGSIIQRFERTGLKMVASKMVYPTKLQLDGHFPTTDEWIIGMGEKTLESYKEYGINPADIFGTSDPLTIGQKIKQWNYHYLTLGPVIVMVLEGIHSVPTVRKLIGHTLPYKADPGTIRCDFSINAPDLANVVGSACKNLVHASGTLEEAQHEIANWFSSAEILVWERADEFVHFVQGELTEKSEKVVDTMSNAELKQKLDSIRESDPRNAAEYAYALAMLSKRSGDDAKATAFAKDSIALFDKCKTDTIEDCSARNMSLGGINIPDLIHQDVVRSSMRPLEV